jgi:hypothetical protein
VVRHEGETQVAENWLLDDQVVRDLRSAIGRGDREVVDLLQRAAATAGGDGAQDAERRLGDRVLWALELALDQGDLEVAEHLELAFEAAMTRFGGPDAVENRDIPQGMARAYERLDELRRLRLRP